MLRRRRNTSDRIYRGSRGGFARYFSPAVPLSGHRDQPLSPRGRLVWRLVLFLMIAGGIAAIWLSR
jgi:hypothetical protein